jgi:DnaK suppressor protein
MWEITLVNESERIRFRALICARLAEIGAESQRGKEARAVVNLDQRAIGRLSRMDALQMQAMAKAQQAMRDGEAKRLAAALDRVEDGSFGTCEDCGEVIAQRRLELNPTATLCIGCASG